MRVLFVSNYYPPYEIGGYEQLCRDVAMRLATRGHHLQILTSRYGVAGRHAVDEPGIHRLLPLLPDYKAQTGPARQFFLTRRRDERRGIASLRQIIAEFHPQALLFWNLEGLSSALALEAESIPGLAVAYWLAGRSPAEPDEFWRYWTYSAPQGLKRSFKALLAPLALAILRAEGKPYRPRMEHVALVSDYLRRTGIESGHIPEHAVVIYNGVETDDYYHPVSLDRGLPLRVLYAGRVSADKGVHTALEALALIVAQNSSTSIHLSIVGSGPAGYAAQLRGYVADHHIEEQVTFLGWQPRERMPALMSEQHVLVLPTTHQEPFARIVLEAMASGLAVLGTLTGGTGEILQHEVTGLAFAPGDAPDLARQLVRLAQDSELRLRLARTGQTMVLHRFSLEHMVDNIERFLEQALAASSV